MQSYSVTLSELKHRFTAYYAYELYSMLFKREINSEIINAARSHPVATITGSRQSGKTIWCLTQQPWKDYTDALNNELNSNCDGK